MREKQVRNSLYREFRYVVNNDYDLKCKVNGEELRGYSKRKLHKLYPDDNAEILGETFEGKKRDRKHDVGRIELNEARLNVGKTGSHSRLLRKPGAYVQVRDGFIVILKRRLLPFLLLGILLLGAAGGVVWGFLQGAFQSTDAGSVSGWVTVDGIGTGEVVLVLRQGETDVRTVSTDKNGRYLFKNVEKGNYNLVCIREKSQQSKLAVVAGEPITIDFAFSGNSDVKAIVKMTDGKTPPIAVGGLTDEAYSHAEDSKEVDVTLLATKMEKSDVPETDKTEIAKSAGTLELAYYDFSVLKEIFKNGVLENAEYLKNTQSVLEIAVPYDSTGAVNTYVFRYHGGESLRFKKLGVRPTDADKRQDGTYFVTADTVYVYTDSFSTYAIGSTYEDESLIIKPDYGLEDEDENQTPIDTETYNVVRLIIPTGKLYFKFRLADTITDDAALSLYYTSDGVEHPVYAEKVRITDGAVADTEIDFTAIHNELIAGTYDGRVVLRFSDNTESEIKIKLYIVNAQGGKIGMGYSTTATVDLASGTIEMMYTLNMNATHNAILQLIIVKDGTEYCIAQSGIVTVGHKLEKMTLFDQYKSILQEGRYKGKLRLNLYNEENPIVGMQPEAEIDVVVK